MTTFDPTNPSPSGPTTPRQLPHIQESLVAQVLSFVAGVELVLGPIIGIVLMLTSNSPGLTIIVSSVLSGLMLLGFAKIIEATNESAQRLRRIEILIQKANEQKGANDPERSN